MVNICDLTPIVFSFTCFLLNIYELKIDRQLHYVTSPKFAKQLGGVTSKILFSLLTCLEILRPKKIYTENQLKN